MTTVLEYNELITLQVIEQDQDLLGIFYDEVDIKFPMIYETQKEGKLEEKVKEVARNIFDLLITTREDFVNQYSRIQRLLNNNVVNYVVDDAVSDAVSDAVIESEPIVEATVEAVADNQETKKPKTEKPKTEKPVREKKPQLPRRFGKEAIMEAVKKEGGKLSPQQRAALEINDLRNIYQNLNRRLVNDMLGEEHGLPRILADEDYRIIAATVDIVKTKLKDILNKK